MNDRYIIDNFTYNGKMISRYNNRLTNEVEEYLNNRFSDGIDSIREAIYRLLHNIEVRPMCPICGGRLKFVGKKNRVYSKTCGSPECLSKHIKDATESVCFKKYGVRNPFQAEEVKEKIKQTMLDKYGCVHPKFSCKYKTKAVVSPKPQKSPKPYDNNRKKYKETCLSRYGVDHPFKVASIKERIKRTCLEKYGVENAGGSEIAIKHIKETKQKRYGDANYNNIEQMHRTKTERYGDKNYSNYEKNRATCLARYGVSYYVQSEDFYNKVKQTSLERYGVEFHTQSEEHRKLMSEIISSSEVQERINNTKRENHSFNKSKEEDVVFELLLEKYYVVMRQYRSTEYPFSCDFYIPSLNLYIEYNGSQYHCGHPFNKEDVNDIKKIEELKHKNDELVKRNGKKSQYAMMLYTWTDLDVRKRNIAKEHNLNYKEFYTVKEVKEWLKTH